jgi:Amidohydrolase
MRLEEMPNFPIIDGHIHYPHPDMMRDLINICDQLKMDRINIVCTPDQQRLSLVPDALHLKAHFRDRIYVFGGLDISAYFRNPNAIGIIFAANVEQLLAVGCDGIKMIEGKPMMRKDLPIPPFDSEVFAPYWQKLEETQTPVVFHVNDPQEFWDSDLAPAWAFERGWFYGDGSFINNEDQYTEIINVLTRHPNLKIIFAHFFFLSAQLSRLASYLDRFPNIYIDLTPGIEMYHNFTKDLDAARDFFLKYQDRIIFGTDIGARTLLVDPEESIRMNESQSRVFVIRNFLESDKEFYLEADNGFLMGSGKIPFNGIGLPSDVLKKIYAGNFENAVSSKPRPLNPGAIIAMCNQIEGMLQFLAQTQPERTHDPSIAQSVRTYFESM